jgi:hemin uptake protein HemP
MSLNTNKIKKQRAPENRRGSSLLMQHRNEIMAKKNGQIYFLLLTEDEQRYVEDYLREQPAEESVGRDSVDSSLLNGYWNRTIVKRKGGLYLDEVKKTLEKFFGLDEEEQLKVVNLRRINDAYEYFAHSFHSSFMTKVVFGNRVYDKMLVLDRKYGLRRRILDKYKNQKGER